MTINVIQGDRIADRVYSDNTSDQMTEKGKTARSLYVDWISAKIQSKFRCTIT